MSYVDANLGTGETVRYRTTLHWAVLVTPVVGLILIGMPGCVFLVAAAKSAAEGTVNAAEAFEAGMLKFAGFAVLVISVGIVVHAFLNRAASEFAVTTKRVIMKVGVVRTRTLEIFLNRVESVGVDQGLGAILFT